MKCMTLISTKVSFIPITVVVVVDYQKLQVEADDTTDDESAPQISLQEMLDDLHLGEDATGAEGAPMAD